MNLWAQASLHKQTKKYKIRPTFYYGERSVQTDSKGPLHRWPLATTYKLIPGHLNKHEWWPQHGANAIGDTYCVAV